MPAAPIFASPRASEPRTQDTRLALQLASRATQQIRIAGDSLPIPHRDYAPFHSYFGGNASKEGNWMLASPTRPG